MKKEVISIPQDRFPLNMVKELGEKAQEAWIFFHESVIKNLKKTADWNMPDGYYNDLEWTSKEKPSKSCAFIQYKYAHGNWYMIHVLRVGSFEVNQSFTPDEIFFFQMEE